MRSGAAPVGSASAETSRTVNRYRSIPIPQIAAAAPTAPTAPSAMRAGCAARDAPTCTTLGSAWPSWPRSSRRGRRRHGRTLRVAGSFAFDRREAGGDERGIGLGRALPRHIGDGRALAVAGRDRDRGPGGRLPGRALLDDDVRRLLAVHGGADRHLESGTFEVRGRFLDGLPDDIRNVDPDLSDEVAVRLREPVAAVRLVRGMLRGPREGVPHLVEQVAAGPDVEHVVVVAVRAAGPDRGRDLGAGLDHHGRPQVVCPGLADQRGAVERVGSRARAAAGHDALQCIGRGRRDLLREHALGAGRLGKRSLLAFGVDHLVDRAGRAVRAAAGDRRVGVGHRDGEMFFGPRTS